MAVDLSVFERQKTVLDQQALQEAFNLKKRAMQLQELDAMAQIQKTMQPEQITPYQAATLELERQKMNTPQAITPYQAASLDIERQRLNQKERPMWSQTNDPMLGMIQRNEMTGEVKPLKTPEAIAKQETMAKGKRNFEDSLASIAAQYDKLKEGGGVSSVQNSGLSNLATGMQTSGAGQMTGRLFGTENQSARNQIAADVPLLTNAIKEATGMSAQQMNSNVELQTFLKALGDPKNDYEANIAILGNLSKKFGTGEVAAAYGAGADPLASARAAIAKGAPREAVIQRLRENNINPEGL